MVDLSVRFPAPFKSVIELSPFSTHNTAPNMFFFDTAADTNFSTNDGSMVVDNYNSPLLIHNGFFSITFHLSNLIIISIYYL